MRTRPFLSVMKVTSLRKAGCITIAPLMISFMGVCHGADKLSEVWRIAVANINQCKFASASLPHVSDLAF